MGATIGLRNDFVSAGLRRLARAARSANKGRRLLASAEIYDGGSYIDTARKEPHLASFSIFSLLDQGWELQHFEK